MLLAAGGAAVEMGAQPGNRAVGVGTGELELDVPVELVEADVAADLGACRAQEPAERAHRVGRLHHFSSSQLSSARPHSCRWARSFCRASCKVL